MTQLSQWGLEPEQGLIRGITSMVLAKLSNPDGGLDMARLRQEGKHIHLNLAGKTALKDKTEEFRETQSLYSAQRDAKHLLSGGEMLRALYRTEGVKGLLAKAAQPGQGFVYDRTRGIVLDSGSIFPPGISSW